MVQPGRKYSDTKYRFGFNGKENENDINGEGNCLDFGARIFDSRLGKWMSVDPLQAKYPGLSPYNFVANSPMNSIDPDGRLIIFINGLWGWPMNVGKGGTADYWGLNWITDAQNAIGDHKSPRFYDGALGGSEKIGGKSNLWEKNRINAGKEAGYKDAKSIIEKLDKDETIKIVTNSMGTAFERGFSDGLLKYRDERLNSIGGELYLAGLQKMNLEKQISPSRLKELDMGILIQPKTDLEKQYRSVTEKIFTLKSEKDKLQKLEIEMVIDLSSHQTSKVDPNAKASYYMTAGKQNMNFWERVFVREKAIKGAKFLGTMSVHHSSGANPNAFPKAVKPN
jgi:RHS repeat-associated protein